MPSRSLCRRDCACTSVVKLHDTLLPGYEPLLIHAAQRAISGPIPACCCFGQEERVQGWVRVG